MKVTHVSIRPTQAAEAAGRPSLTPELLAATGARYSRSGEGLDKILARVDQSNPDKSVDAIFKMVDYGHASIADMAPVAMFIDGPSLFLIYYVWSISPQAGGQETSTRYLRFDANGLVDASLLGIFDNDFIEGDLADIISEDLLPAETIGIYQSNKSQWETQMRTAFEGYNDAVALWTEISESHPELIRIPESILSDPSDKSQKIVARMRRNYVFDRARYFIPVAAANNMMMVMSARAWVGIIQTLLSTDWQEAVDLGNMIKGELELVTPRLVRHARFTQSTQDVLRDEFRDYQEIARRDTQYPNLHEHGSSYSAAPYAYLSTHNREFEEYTELTTMDALRHRENRYSLFGNQITRMSVKFGWDAVAMAELRDLNRHRTGTKYAPLAPIGFYCAEDQLPENGDPSYRIRLADLANQVGHVQTLAATEKLLAGDMSYVYYTLLGTQYPFEHTTTADKFIYEAELRTGVGAHYRYAQHLRDTLELWYKKYPETKGVIFEGSAEPE